MNTAAELSTNFATAPLPAGFTLRNWRDNSDYEKMRRVLFADKHSQGIEESDTAADLQAHLESMPHMDVTQNVFLVERDGEVVAYQSVRGYPEASGLYCYNHHGFVLPEYKKRGIGRAMIQHSETVLRALAGKHPADADKTFQVFVDSQQTDLAELLAQAGYAPIRYFNRMLRPHLDNIPDVPLPEGLEIRPVTPDQMHAIWQADVAAFSEHWGETEHTEEDYQRWLKRPFIQPDYWHIAWDGNRIAGLVLNFIDQEENETFNRKRGLTDDIGTLKEYRGRGIAQALITRGLKQFRDVGMTEASLDVDTENATGALRLYEKLGYRPIQTMAAYRKSFTL